MTSTPKLPTVDDAYRARTQPMTGAGIPEPSRAVPATSWIAKAMRRAAGLVDDTPDTRK